MSDRSQTVASPLRTLLPVRALTVTLEFTTEADFGFFHQAAVYAFVGHLLGPAEKLDTQLAIDAPVNKPWCCA